MGKASFKYHVIIYMLFAGTCIAPDAFAEWVSMPSGVTNNLKSVWGSASNDVFAVGSNGAILHYDGATWTKMETATTANLEAVSGSAANNVVSLVLPELFCAIKARAGYQPGAALITISPGSGAVLLQKALSLERMAPFCSVMTGIVHPW